MFKGKKLLVNILLMSIMILIICNDRAAGQSLVTPAGVCLGNTPILKSVQGSNIPAYEPEFTAYKTAVINGGGTIVNEDSVKNAFTYIKANGGFQSGINYVSGAWGITGSNPIQLIAYNTEEVIAVLASDIIAGITGETFIVYNKNLSGITFNEVTMNGQTLDYYNFSNCSFTSCDMRMSTFTYCNFTGAVFSGEIANSNRLQSCNFSFATGVTDGKLAGGASLTDCPYTFIGVDNTEVNPCGE